MFELDYNSKKRNKKAFLKISKVYSVSTNLPRFGKCDKTMSKTNSFLSALD